MHRPLPLEPLFDWPVADIFAALPSEDDPIWGVFNTRQAKFEVHNATRSIVFRWLEELMIADPQPVARLTYPAPVLSDAVNRAVDAIEGHYGGTAVRALLVELAPGQTIPPHRDHGLLLRDTHRCHLPILTHEGVRFPIDGFDHHLAAGIVYEVDNMRRHSVANPGPGRRVHLIVNVLPSGWTPPSKTGVAEGLEVV